MSAELTTGRPADRNERRDPRTQETPTQRWNRHYLEILQETRAAQIGTQLLLVFLLTLAFTSRFDETTRFQRMVYVVSLVLVAGATCLLIAPAPFHRLVFRQRLEAQLVRASSRFAFWGITLMMLAVNGVLLLILDVVMGTSYALPITGGTLLWFLTWWYFAPGWTRRGQKRRRKEATIVALEVASEKLRSERVHSERVRSERMGGTGLARALGASRPVSAPALGSLTATGSDRVLPGPHPPQLRPGPTWPAPRLPMMPAPQPPRAGAEQLGYPGGRLPALGFDRPSPQPGAATGRYGGFPPHRAGGGPAPVSGPHGPGGPAPAVVPAPVSGPAGSIRSGLGGHFARTDVPTGPYASVDPLGPAATGPLPLGPHGGPFEGAAAHQPDGSTWTTRNEAARDGAPWDGGTWDGITREGGARNDGFTGTDRAAGAGRHHGISLTGLPAAYTTGEVPLLHPTGDLPRLGPSAGTPTPPGAWSGDGMQHGRADNGITQFGVALPLGPAPTGLPTQGGPAQGGPAQGGPAQGGPAQGGPAQGGPAQGGPAQGGPAQGGPAQGGLAVAGGAATRSPDHRGPGVQTPAGAAGPAIAGPAVAGPAPVGPTDTGSYPLLPEDGSPADSGDGVVGRARVTPPNPPAPKHG